MSSNQSYSSSTSYSYSSSSSSNGQTTIGHSQAEHIHSGPDGTKVTRQTQNLGEPAVRETRQYDAQGRELIEGSNGNTANRITDVDQAERDRQYEERMEDEYAKREGGA